MPFAVLSFGATDTLLVSKFVLSAPDELKEILEERLCVEAGEEDQSRDDDEMYATWNGNVCVLSKGYLIDVHELLNLIEEQGYRIDQFSTSLTGAGVQNQTYVFRHEM